MSDWSHQWEVFDEKKSPREGGQGEVFQVRHKHRGHIGALKRLHNKHQGSTERRFRVQQEVNALLAIDGKGAPRILDSNVEQWQDKTIPLWVVMEWVPGKTLQDHVNNSPLELDEALSLTEDLLRTVGVCHQLSTHHRDLKPDNVIVREGDHRPILVDFGMSWTKPETDDERDFRTPVGQEIGNRFLRLPEHFANRRSYSDASDLTMVVGLLFFMLTATAPRALEDGNRRMPHEHSKDRFGELLYDVRWPRLQRVFNIAFQQDSDWRFQNTEEILMRLGDLTPPTVRDGDDDWREELARIDDLKNSALGRKIEASKPYLLEGNKRFLSKYLASLNGSGFVSGGGGPDFVEGDRATQLAFSMFPEGGSNPLVTYTHRIALDGAQFTATVKVEGEEADTYYVGPASDPEALYEAVEQKVGSVLAMLLRKMNAKLSSFYGA